MIGTKKWINTKTKTETPQTSYVEYMCYNFSDQYYKFVLIDRCRISPRFIKIPIIANIASDYIHNNLFIDDDDDHRRASP